MVPDPSFMPPMPLTGAETGWVVEYMEAATAVTKVRLSPRKPVASAAMAAVRCSATGERGWDVLVRRRRWTAGDGEEGDLQRVARRSEAGASEREAAGGCERLLRAGCT